ncbi:MAG: hypothetical protein NTZ25_01175 [Candidatus Peregrinibacteria bacterium]|nr:hypothetical protein [Candidatus Peregrinibacteria bacterium]
MNESQAKKTILLDEKSKATNKMILIMIIVGSLIIGALSSPIILGDTSGGAIGFMIGSALFPFLLSIVAYKACTKVLEEDFKKNRIKFINGAVLAIIVLGLMWFIQKDAISINFQNKEAINDIKNIVSGVKLNSDGTVELGNQNEPIKSEIGKVFINYLAKFSTLGKNYLESQNKIITLESINDFKDISRLKSSENSYLESKDISNSYFNEYSSTVKMFDEDMNNLKSKDQSQFIKDTIDGFNQSFDQRKDENEKMKNLILAHIDAEISFLDFLINNNDKFDVSSGKVVFNNNQALSKYNELLQQETKSTSDYNAYLSTSLKTRSDKFKDAQQNIQKY